MKDLRIFNLAYALLMFGVLVFVSCSSENDDNGENDVNGDNTGSVIGTNVGGTIGKAVDLGLPSGTKWADHNIGASSPEESGCRFAWGETSPKDEYTKGNSVTYNLKIAELKSEGIIDDNNNLTAAYDAATVNWGGKWKMPTAAQMLELIDECKWTRSSNNGVRGYYITGTNGNVIFLPHCYLSIYWSSKCYIDQYTMGGEEYRGYSYVISFDKNDVWVTWGFAIKDNALRYNGHPIRPISQ